MEPDKQRKFNFGTGEIDVDQWLRDIDAGLPDYYDRMSKTYHKKENEEVRNAMTDLIGRISSGDMLSRSANGTYNFKSQLYSPNRGKYTRWAYQTALSYLGGKGRGLVAPPKQEEEKKEETKKNIYSTQSLLKRFNNSVQRGSTQLDLGTTWWGTATPEARAKHLSEFLNKEAAYVKTTDDVDEVYKDLGKEGLATSMSTLAQEILANPNGDYGRQFGNLGINNILKKTVQPTEKNQPKTVDEQLQEAQNAEANRQKQIQLGWIQNRGQDTYFNKDYNLYQNSMQYLNKVHEDRRNGTDISNIIPKVDDNTHAVNGGAIGAVIGNMSNAQAAYKSHFSDNIERIKQFLPILQSNWESLFTNGALSYNDNDGNTLNMTPQQLWENLAILTHQMPDKNGQMGYTYLDNSRNYPISVGDQLYYIPGTYKQNGNILLFDVYNKRLVKSSIANYPELQNTLGAGVLFKKEGGIIKYAGGGQTEDNYTRFGVQSSYEEQEPVTEEQPKTQNPVSYEWKPEDYARIGGAGADIISALSANIPIYGTAVSAVTGVGSTLANTYADWSQDGWEAGLRTALFGLGTDALGLIPGWGMSAKLGKIARGLQRYSKYLGAALAAGGFKQAASIANKGFTQGWDNITPDEWSKFAQGLSGIAKGTAGVKRANRANLQRGAVTHAQVRTPNETKVVTLEELKKLKDQGDVIKYKPIITEKGLLNAQSDIIKQSRFYPFSKVSDNRFAKMYDFSGVSSKNYRYIDDVTVGYIAPRNVRGNSPINISNPFNKEKALDKLKKFRQPKVEEGNEEIVEHLHGGILKYKAGGQTGVKPGKAYNWQNNVFDQYKNHILEGLKGPNADSYMEWLNSMQGKHAKIYNDAGGDSNTWQTTAFKSDDIKNYQTDYQRGFDGYDVNNPYNMYGIGNAYKVLDHYDFSASKNRATKETSSITGNNGTFQAIPDGLFSQITDDRRLLGRVGDWDNNKLQEFAKQLNALGFDIYLDDNDLYYRIKKFDGSKVNEDTSDAKNPGDQENENGINPNPQPQLNKPFDPRALYIMGRGASTILGNDWLYDRIYDRLPGPVYKDFIDRKLDTIGDYAALAHGANQAADLKAIQRLRQVSDQTLNLAADFESGRIGREIEDKSFLQDATKQATTHEAALQLDLKDLEDRRDVAWYNRAALNEYLGKRADILNARDKARVDATLGMVNNLTALGTSKYLEKKNAYDQARSVLIREPRETAIERIKTEYPELYDKVYSGKDLTSQDIAKYNQLLSKYQEEARIKYARDYYANYGGTVYYPKQHGVENAKHGSKLNFIKSLRS